MVWTHKKSSEDEDYNPVNLVVGCILLIVGLTIIFGANGFGLALAIIGMVLISFAVISAVMLKVQHKPEKK